MTRIGVFSDSHGAVFNTRRFIEIAKREQWDAIVFLGDGLDEAKTVAKETGIPVHAVAGNCDFLSDEARERRLTFDRVNVLALHGDRFPVKYDLTSLSYYAEQVGAKLTLFGHTHRSFAAYVGSALLVNPGSLKSGCYATVTFDRDIVPRLLEL